MGRVPRGARWQGLRGGPASVCALATTSSGRERLLRTPCAVVLCGRFVRSAHDAFHRTAPLPCCVCRPPWPVAVLQRSTGPDGCRQGGPPAAARGKQGRGGRRGALVDDHDWQGDWLTSLEGTCVMGWCQVARRA